MTYEWTALRSPNLFPDFSGTASGFFWKRLRNRTREGGFVAASQKAFKPKALAAEGFTRKLDQTLFFLNCVEKTANARCFEKRFRQKCRLSGMRKIRIPDFSGNAPQNRTT